MLHDADAKLATGNLHLSASVLGTASGKGDPSTLRSNSGLMAPETAGERMCFLDEFTDPIPDAAFLP